MPVTECVMSLSSQFVSVVTPLSSLPSDLFSAKILTGNKIFIFIFNQEGLIKCSIKIYAIINMHTSYVFSVSVLSHIPCYHSFLTVSIYANQPLTATAHSIYPANYFHFARFTLNANKMLFVAIYAW